MAKSVVTKTGDSGQSRWNLKAEDKSGPLLEAIGALDELQAVLGLLKMDDIQRDLSLIMGQLAYEAEFIELRKRVETLEKEILIMENGLPELSGFLIFSGEKSAMLNWARTIARRAERRVVALNKNIKVDQYILIYLNRLSDYLFVLARKSEI